MTKDEEFRNFISEIKARADCRDIFRRFWPDKYRERGNCACPFHEDRDPSMQLSEDLAYCHSEGLSLDAIDLYARGAGCTRGEAIKQLASELGIQRYHEPVRSNPNADYFARRMQEAVQRGLPDEAVRYLKNRGIEPDIIQRLKAERLIGWDEKYSAIAFPLYDWNRIEILGIQVIPVDGSKKRFIKGTNSRKAFFRFGCGSELTVFSEGIINALSIAQICRELESVALLSAGMTDKLDGLTFQREPVLFLDNDEAGRKGAAKVLHRFGPKYRLIDWSIAREGTEGIGKINDANDLLKADQGPIIRKMVEMARVPEKEEIEQIISLYVAKKKSLPSSGADSDEDGKQTQAQLLFTRKVEGAALREKTAEEYIEMWYRGIA